MPPRVDQHLDRSQELGVAQDEEHRHHDEGQEQRHSARAPGF